MTRQNLIAFPEEPLESTVVSVCCRECDTETTGKRADLYGLGWSDFVFERNLSWTWFDFSAVCPKCAKGR